MRHLIRLEDSIPNTSNEEMMSHWPFGRCHSQGCRAGHRRSWGSNSL